MYYGSWTYVPVAERRAAARKEVSKREKAGHKTAPVVIAGRNIASTFWGKAWCTNLERYSDYANRLPRGRTYVRNGSVVDLQIARSQISRSPLLSVLLYSISLPGAMRKRWNGMWQPYLLRKFRNRL